MAVLCRASITWFKEPGHVRVDDTCVLENGHEEFDHLPSGKVHEQNEVRVWNGALDAATAALTHTVNIDGDFADGQLAQLIVTLNTLRR